MNDSTTMNDLDAEGLDHEESTARPKVLLVDDDAGVRRILGRLLAREFEVVTASDGEEALTKLNEDIDTIVSDIYMPHLGGLEFLSALQERELDVPTILLTGAPSVDSAAQALEVRAFRYLSKPIQGEELLRVVRYSTKVCRNRRKRSNLVRAIEGSLRNSEREAFLGYRLDEALDKMWLAMQPIRDTVEGVVVGYETLLRTDERSLDNPGEFIRVAEELGRVPDIGRRVRDTVAAVIPEIDARVSIFVNVHAGELDDEHLYAPDAKLARYAHRVVFEITENAQLPEMKKLRSCIHKLHELGYRVALDDLGAGHNGLASFSSIVPDIVKLDARLVRDIHERPLSLDLVKALIGICRTCNIELIAEGVETELEYQALRELDCSLMQGYLFGRPKRVLSSTA